MFLPATWHWWVLHCLCWECSPSQSLPPWSGAGLSQSLCRVLRPPPQVWEHWDQSAQDPQEPDTGPARNQLLKWMELPSFIHWLLLQILDCEFFPVQYSPPLTGAGELQLLTFSFIPPPQVREHWDQLCQAPQEPSTGLDFLGQIRWTVFSFRFIIFLESYWDPSGLEIVSPQLK